MTTDERSSPRHGPLPIVPRRVLVVEDEALTRGLVVELLSTAGFEVRACQTAAEAMKAVKEFDPDALVTDIDLGPGPSGLDLVVNLSRSAPHVAVLVLSNYPILRQHPVRSGHRLGYLDKRNVDSPAKVVEALESTLREEHDDSESAQEAEEVLSRLSRPQLETLHMMAKGFSNAEIAEQRGISKRAAESLVQRTVSALGINPDRKVNPRVLAVRMYYQTAGLPES